MITVPEISAIVLVSPGSILMKSSFPPARSYDEMRTVLVSRSTNKLSKGRGSAGSPACACCERGIPRTPMQQTKKNRSVTLVFIMLFVLGAQRYWLFRTREMRVAEYGKFLQPPR